MATPMEMERDPWGRGPGACHWYTEIIASDGRGASFISAPFSRGRKTATVPVPESNMVN